MKMTQRLLSLLLALAMVLTILPVSLTAAAEETAPVTEDVQVPEQAENTDAETDAAGTQIPTVGEKVAIEPWINPLYEGMIDESALNPHVPNADPDASVQASFVSASNAGVTLRSYMKSRIDSVTLYVSSDSSSYATVLDEVLAVAVEHTGNGREGDYLGFQVAGVGGSYDREYVSSKYRYTFELTVTYFTTAAQEKEVTNAVYNLISSLGVKHKSDYEKISTVYNYMCQNITYDYDHLEDPDYLLQFSAYAALINKTAVCQGYAVLFYRIMLDLGIDCRVIGGIGGDAENYGPHAWNIVELDGLYYNMDTTWDAGNDEYVWFMNNSWNFIYHYREAAYETMEFHTAYPMAAEDYDPDVEAVMDPYIYLGLCGDEAVYLMGRDGSITVAGSGAMYDYGTSDEKMPEWRYMWGDYITSVTITEGITRIGNCAYAHLENLTSVTLPDGLEEIGHQAFHKCLAITSIDIPDTVTGIYGNAFSSCSSLTSIELPGSLTTLGDYAFAKNAGITELHIRKPITTVGTGVFSECTSLVSVTFEDDSIHLGAHMFEGCSVLKDVNLPADLTAIPKYAFAECSALDSITLPEKLTSIDSSAFSQCTSLSNVKLPEGLTVIGSSAFFGCKSLDSIAFPETLTEISNNAFEKTGLTEVFIPKSITTVGSAVFRSCTSLVSVTFEEDYIPMGTHMFESCSALKDVNLPADLTAIPESAFEGCTALSTIALPEGLTSIDSRAFAQCTSLSNVVLPEGLTAIRSRAFSGCASLSSIIFPETLTLISEYAFAYTPLTEVSFPASVTTIGRNAFVDCDQLTEVYIPETVTSLSGFSGCDNLERAYLYNTGRIGDYAFSNCKKLSYVEFSENNTAIGIHSFEGCSALTEISFPDSITFIDGGAFGGCINLESVDLNNVSYVGSSAFFNCKALKTLIFGENTTYLGIEALRYCSSLTEITIPAVITANGANMNFLGDNTNLTKITFLGDAPKFNYYSFQNITATVYYPGNNATWTTDIMKDYSGTITWVAYACSHSYEAVITAPTCTEGGYTTYTCSECGHSYVDDYTDPAGHTPGEIQVENVVDATCTAEGSYDNVTYCTVCGTETGRETVVTEKLAHSYSAEVTDPTCTDRGYTTHTCSACGHSYLDSYVDALGHSCSEYELTLVPTGFKTGKLTGTCTVCSETATVELPALNSRDYAIKVTQEPTETETGTAIYTWNNTDYGVVSFEVTLRSLSDKILLGDINGDGNINILDANLAASYYNEVIDLTEDQLLAADVNGDGIVNILDANLIAAYYNEVIDSFPAA